MHGLKLLLSILGCCLLAAPASAQGADNCSSPQSIAGTGIFTYDTLTSTSGGPKEAFLSIPGIDSMDNDVWFSWTAPQTSVYQISNCFPAANTFPTYLAIYEYGCPGLDGRAVEAAGINCQGSVFSNLRLGTQAGTTYLIRIGHTLEAHRDTGLFSIDEFGFPGVLGSKVNPANGATYHFLEPSSWTVAQAAAVVMGGNLVTVNDPAENDWLRATFLNWGGQPRSFWIGYNDAETEGVWKWASGETPGFVNWSSGGVPNNEKGVEHYAHFRHDWANGSWNDLLGFPQSGYFYDTVHGVVEVDGGPPVAGWQDLGGGTPGIAGVPSLAGTGTLVGGTPASVMLSGAPPNAAMVAWISFGPTPFTALSGTVHAFPFAGQFAFFSTGAGTFTGATTWPAGVPPGTQAWFQFVIEDLSSVFGLTLSNGLRATTP